MAVRVEKNGPVTTVLLHRPEVKNAVDRATAEALADVFRAFDADESAAVAVLHGEGGTFCAGADLKAISRGEAIVPVDPVKAGWGFAGIVTHAVSVPIIAAVNGTALGGGTELVLACDLAVAVEEATFGLPEVKRGLVASAGGLYRLPRALPQAVALEMILTGEPIPAERALQLGLINALAERDGLLAAAQALAARITVNAPVAVRQSLGVAKSALDLSDAELQGLSAKAQAAVMASEDFKEGPRAFIEKRAPRWTGR